MKVIQGLNFGMACALLKIEIKSNPENDVFLNCDQRCVLTFRM